MRSGTVILLLCNLAVLAVCLYSVLPRSCISIYKKSFMQPLYKISSGRQRRCRKPLSVFGYWLFSGYGAFTLGYLLPCLIFELVERQIIKVKWVKKHKTENIPTQDKKRTCLQDLVVISKSLLMAAPINFYVYAAAASNLNLSHNFGLNWISFIAYTLATPFVSELYIYYVHRILHLGPIYRRVHKVHHEYKTVDAWSAAYLHPLDIMFAAAPHYIIMLPLVRADLWVNATFVFLSSLFNTLAHTGYDVVGLGSTVYHALHHKRTNVNYGSNGFLDKVHGTLLEVDEKDRRL